MWPVKLPCGTLPRGTLRHSIPGIYIRTRSTYGTAAALLIGVAFLVGCQDSILSSNPSRGQEGYRGTRGYETLEDGIPEHGLLAWLPFEGNSQDQWSGRHDAALNGPRFVFDRFGRPEAAIAFDGVDDYAVLSGGTRLQTLPISISFWARLDQKEETSGIITTSLEQNRNTGVFLTFDSKSGAPAISVGNGERIGGESRRTLHSEVALAAGEWNHIVGIVDSTDAGVRMQLFVNGKYPDFPHMSGGADPVLLENGWGSVTIGRRFAATDSPPLYFRGAVDDIAFYGRVLSFEEIGTLYRSRGLR